LPVFIYLQYTTKFNVIFYILSFTNVKIITNCAFTLNIRDVQIKSIINLYSIRLDISQNLDIQYFCFCYFQCVFRWIFCYIISPFISICLKLRSALIMLFACLHQLQFFFNVGCNSLEPESLHYSQPLKHQWLITSHKASFQWDHWTWPSNH